MNDRDQFQIVPAEPSHLFGMARTHIACFPDVFSSSLGIWYTQAFYQAYLENAKGIAYVAIGTDGKVVGLIAGGAPDIRDYFVARAKRKYTAKILRRFVTSFRPWRAVLRSLRHRLTARQGKESAPIESPANSTVKTCLLQVICVCQECRGTPVAQELMGSFAYASRQAGFDRMRLTVHSDNARAIAFYSRCGWHTVAQTAGTTVMERQLAD